MDFEKPFGEKKSMFDEGKVPAKDGIGISGGDLVGPNAELPKGGTEKPPFFEGPKETVYTPSQESSPRENVRSYQDQLAEVDRLTKELNEAARGRLEGEIGLEDAYWSVRNRLTAANSRLEDLRGK